MDCMICAAGVTDLDRLVEMFVEAEDANFSLFNYVNEVNAEIEKLEDQIGEIRSEVERLRGERSQQETLRLQAVHVRPLRLHSRPSPFLHDLPRHVL